jgi:ACT domain-containing protein
MRAIITVVGVDRIGIIAGVSNLLAEARVNILDISQTILKEYFTMIMLVDLSAVTIGHKDLVGRLDKKGEELGVSIRMQHEDVFNAMHRI